MSRVVFSWWYIFASVFDVVAIVSMVSIVSIVLLFVVFVFVRR